MKKSTKIIIAVLSFLVMSAAYEYIVNLWGQGQQGAIIRVDIFMIYPLLIALSVGIYYLLGKGKKALLYTIIGIIVMVFLVGFIKFNFINDDVYYPNENGEYVNDYGKQIEFIDDDEITEEDKMMTEEARKVAEKMMKEDMMTRKDDLCDENGMRYKTAEEAQMAGLKEAEYGATMCPEYKMHPSWDKNKDGINDCYDDNSCSMDMDYMSPRK